MWLAYAAGSALFAGITSVLAKIGIKNIDSDLATALRTIVVWLFSWLMVFVVDSQNTVRAISTYSLVFLILSGAATGASWLWQTPSARS
jgi:transporter family protein